MAGAVIYNFSRMLCCYEHRLQWKTNFFEFNGIGMKHQLEIAIFFYRLSVNS